MKPLVDGNKRATFQAVGVLLAGNGHRLAATQADAIDAVVGLAAGELDEAHFADWIRAHPLTAA